MNNRTPPVRQPTTLPHTPPAVGGSAALNTDGFDTRSFSSLSPLEQLQKLEADGKRTADEQRSRRDADALWRAQQSKEVKS